MNATADMVQNNRNQSRLMVRRDLSDRCQMTDAVEQFKGFQNHHRELAENLSKCLLQQEGMRFKRLKGKL